MLTQTFPWTDAPSAEFAVIAEDASHSLSPAMHGAAFESLALPYKYVAVNVPRGKVSQALSGLREKGYVGLNVTMPHKVEALDWLSEFRNPEYPEVEAVNTIRIADRVGFNTDTLGLQRSFSGLNLQPGECCLLLGAGGSARAALGVLTRLGVRVRIWNRSHQRAVELASLSATGGPAMEQNGQGPMHPAVAEMYAALVAVATDPDPTGCRLILNTTSAGKQGESLPVLWDNAPAGAEAHDLFYAAQPTPFLLDGAAHGLATKDGVELLVNQGAEAWKCWGIQAAPPVELMGRVVREVLGSNA